MFDLFIALATLALPRIWASIGTPNMVIGSIATASILIWPGYIVVRWLWPGDQISFSQRLAYIPAFGTLSTIIVSLLAWVIVQRATPEITNLLMLISMAAIIVGITATQPLPPEDSAQRTSTYREFATAFVMFIVLAIGIGLLADAPHSRITAPALTLYLDPASAPVYDRSTDSVKVPIVVTNAETSTGASLTLMADVSDQLVAEKRIELAPGAQNRVDLSIPGSVLSPNRARPVEIRLQPVGASPADGRMLRLWLSTGR